MRVLFLTLYPEPAASPRYRVLQFVPFLEVEGIECVVRSALTSSEYVSLKDSSGYAYHSRELCNRVAQIKEGGGYDVVFLQKAIATIYVRGMAGRLRKHAQRLVYDIDDAVHQSPPVAMGPPWSVLENRHQVKRIMGEADLVLAGNAWLKEAALDEGAINVELFPTVVDTNRFRPGEKGDGTYRIGWMGSPSTTAHLSIAAPALAEAKDAEVMLVGASTPVPGLENAEFRPWSGDTEVALLQKMSVGVMPLPKDDWSRGKCALKTLQYMACGVPCVATPHGAVLDIIEDGKNGLFADSHDQWRDALESLRDPVYRKKLGDAGRQTVEEKFSLDKAGPRLAALLKGLV